jgi:hypothetical protein
MPTEKCITSKRLRLTHANQLMLVITQEGRDVLVQPENLPELTKQLRGLTQ